MEALFDTINVRDLLSAHDLTDPTTPLSAPDLRLLVNRLESHSLQIKSKVQSYLLSHQNDFSSLFSLCNDAVSRTDRISNQLSDILGMISDRPIDVEIREAVEEMGRKMREVRVKKELLALVGLIVGFSERLEGVKEGLRNGRLRFAAEEVREMKMALRVGEEDEGDPVVYGLLRNEWMACFEEIQEVLVKCMEKAVRFDQESNSLLVKCEISVDGIGRVELRTVFEAMDVLGILDYGLAKIADLMIKYVIIPAVNCNPPITFIEDSNQGSKEMTEAILKMEPSLDPKIENNDGETIYSGITQVIQFLYKCLCFQNGSWIRCFGRLTWPRIAELIISSFLSKVVPEDASKLADFQKIIKCTSDFENSLRGMMFISASDRKDDNLSSFAENVEVHFASRKKTEILAKARNLLLQCDFAVPQEYTPKGHPLKNSKHVVELLFSSQSCVVSEAASQLMELVHQTLQGVCLSSTRVSLEFYRAARDAILLYEAVIPVKLEKQLDGINEVAVLIHNDCLFLSQEILGLAFEYRLDFPSSIKEHAVFADIAPRFHLMAEEILQRQVQLVIFNLREAIDGAYGFQNTHQMQQFESAKFSIDQVVFILEKVHIIWEPLLLPSTYKRSMCMVLESVLSRITKDILLLDDMAAEETLQLQRLIHLLMENLSSLLESLIAEDDTCLLYGFIPSLRKIRKLAELLDMPLKSITTAWESGELLRCGFSIPEVEDFIKAIFTDSPLRKECLRRIENVSL
ncbi:Zw10 domain-containing protein [Cephalotus follicularis]|uniref:Zw10 domain-containing protein n=1 Tax=Cephalotus follicularis TaxID=3775 RepID=A0A1Q3B322_CEPFO|nr:Zw10 domain-containing protein [Cephalotus follicularis]